MGNRRGLEGMTSSDDLPQDYFQTEWIYSACAQLRRLLLDLLVMEYSYLSSSISLVQVWYFSLARAQSFLSACCLSCFRVFISFFRSYIQSSYLQTISQSLSFHSRAICSVLRLQCDSTSTRQSSPERSLRQSNFLPSRPLERSAATSVLYKACSYLNLFGAQFRMVRWSCQLSFCNSASCNLRRVLSISRAVRDWTRTEELKLLIYALFMLIVDFLSSCRDIPTRSLLGVCGASSEDFSRSLYRSPSKSTLYRQRVNYSLRCQFSSCSLVVRYFARSSSSFNSDTSMVSCYFSCLRDCSAPEWSFPALSNIFLSSFLYFSMACSLFLSISAAFSCSFICTLSWQSSVVFCEYSFSLTLTLSQSSFNSA